ncbi:MAG: hypothetical protein WKF91_08985 [Segetibacter sp.]
MFKLVSLLNLLFFISVSGSTQSLGGFPPDTKWRQINTDSVRVIFTQGATQQAERIASIVHQMAAAKPIALGNNFRKLNIVLHSNTTLYNGYVSLAPFRSEFYLIPGTNVFDFGNLPWHENLAIHEYRHAQQFNNGRNGVSKILNLLLGESGQAIANNLAVPGWFWEGDAVHAETALTNGGRGRLSKFLSSYNSLWQEKKEYSWMKLRNGSYKDFVPNHYDLGYLLVNYGYLKYGEEFWGNVFKDATAFKRPIYPMQYAIKRNAKINFSTFHKEAFNYYKQMMDTPATVNKINDKTVTSYYYPQYISADSILYLKSAYNQTPAFFIKDNKGEHKIALRSLAIDEWFSYKKGKIAYTAYSTHPRWSLQNYSEICMLDIYTGREKRFTSKTKYYTPDFSPSGDTLVAIAINDSLQTELHLINAGNGNVVSKVKVKSNLYLLNPRFVDSNRIIAAVRKDDGLISLHIFHLSTGVWEEVLPFSTNTIGQPYVQGNQVFFIANYKGNDDAYVLDLGERKLARLTGGKTGNYFVSAYNDNLLYSSFTTKGLQLQKAALTNLQWTDISKLSHEKKASIYPVALEKPNLFVDSKRTFSQKKYSKSAGLFNFHSWEPTLGGAEYGLALTGNNILNTFSSEIYYRYNSNETSHTGGAAFSYIGFFPVLSAGINYTANRTLKTTDTVSTFNQAEARVGYSIPLDFTKGKTFKSLHFGSDYIYQYSNASQGIKDSLADKNASYLYHFVSWSHQLPGAVQQIYPKLGVRMILNYRHLTKSSGYQSLGGVEAYLPSHKNNSIVLGFAFQQKDTSSIIFTNRFPNSRGYAEKYFSKMWRASANYHLPLFYPDWGFADLLYFHRVRSNFFFDYTKSYSNDNRRSRNSRSTGVEMIFDGQLINALSISFGFRYSYLLDQNFMPGSKHRFEFIIPISLIPE